MGGGVTPPSVMMSCPGATIYGSPPTVTAVVDQSATIIFYLDENRVSSGSGTSVSYTPGTSVSVGTHTIEVIASNTNGSDSVSCSWTVVEPLIIYREDPSYEYVLDPLGVSRTFSARVNKAANIQFYLDSIPIDQIYLNILNASHSFGSIEESHTISVHAEQLLESVDTQWYWYPIVPIPDEDTLISENECHPTPQVLNAYLVIKSRLYKKQNGDCYVIVDYQCTACGGCSQGSHMSLLGCDISLHIQVWWDPITIPNNIEDTIDIHNCSINGWKSFTIPSGVPYVDVVTELNTTCEVQVDGVSGFQYGNSTCTMRLLHES